MLEKTQGIFVGLIIAAWVIIMFFGYIGGVGKTFKAPPKNNKNSASEILKEQRDRTDDLVDQRKRLMEDRQQRLKDMQQMRMR